MTSHIVEVQLELELPRATRACHFSPTLRVLRSSALRHKKLVGFFFISSPYTFIFTFAAFEMATTSSTTTSAVPSAADSSMQQRRVAPKRRAQRRMIYGFTFSYEELVEWGQQHFGETDDEEKLQHYVRKSMGPLFARCYRLWRRTTKHIVTYYSGSRRDDEDWCLCLADNISRDTATPPPQELIDKIKEALEITRDPEWHRFYGD